MTVGCWAELGGKGGRSGLVLFDFSMQFIIVV